MKTTLWKRKLAAWLHDPAEKALVLMRDVDNTGKRIGHESGSVATLRAALGIRKDDFDKRADHYAAAADRPQWPFEDGRARPAWANVRFVERPVLIHPLSGQELDLGKLDEVHAAHIRTASMEHFLDLVERDAAGVPDHRFTQLAFWRFGPEPALVARELGALWRLLPADTRVPDHTIWQHLDVVSALSGAMAGDETPALLTMSFGPVQGFIAQARSTSDLWAGSHLLSSLVWEGLRVICDELGPDAVLFPNLRGVACVDRWLLEAAPGWRARFEEIGAGWLGKSTDQNPLFAATLPNKFMAIVPSGRARELADRVTTEVRAAALNWATEAGFELFDSVGRATGDEAHWREQVRSQLHGFPEVHWSAADWPLAKDEQDFPVTTTLEHALAAFYPEGERSAFFASPLWQLMSEADVVELPVKGRTLRRLQLDGEHQFFVPNSGLLYPAVHELAERGLASAKALRSFDALPQEGYRCTLTGESEWLTDDPQLLALPPGERKSRSVWEALAPKPGKPGKFGIKSGEHLGAIATLKRLWPTLFTRQVRALLDDEPVTRFVVSTHTMALATSLGRLAEGGDPGALARLAALSDCADEVEPAVLPASLARLARRLYRHDPNVARVMRALPTLLENARDDDDDTMLRRIAELFGHRPETYYGLIKMDGDRMGAWMAGNEPDYQRSFADSWHPQVRDSVQQKFGHEPRLRAYMASPRPASPARHAAISAVLNDFSTHVARHVVEEVFKGKLLYAGGDDVLAMVSVDDLLPCMLLLRAAYSGVGEWGGLPGMGELRGLALGSGYVGLGASRNARLMPMMGIDATASIGAVVAHHQAPLGTVMRELRSAEHQAKAHREGGRNAFCLRVMKRGGGEVGVTSRFWDQAHAKALVRDEPLRLAGTALGLILRFAETLAQSDMSRRAVYNTTEWLAALPARDACDRDGMPTMSDGEWQRMVTVNLAMQFERQKGLREHAAEFVRLACAESEPDRTLAVLEGMLVTAEFFAREGRFSREGDR